MTRQLQPCGTRAAYRRHLARGESCQACRAAATAENRRYRAKPTKRGPYGKPRCGTYSGYQKHLRTRQPICDACRAAVAERQREYRAMRKDQEATVTTTNPREEQLRTVTAVLRRIPDPDGQRAVLDALFAEGRRKHRELKQPPPAVKAAADRRSFGDPLVDAAPSREHVRHLIERENGMTLQSVADAASVSKSWLGMLLQGQYLPGRPELTTIRADTERRILAVAYAEPPPRPAPTHCRANQPFTPAGYNVGRCGDCGQLAPAYHGRLTGHPRADITSSTEQAA